MLRLLLYMLRQFILIIGTPTIIGADIRSAIIMVDGIITDTGHERAFISESASSVNHQRNPGVRLGELPGFLVNSFAVVLRSGRTIMVREANLKGVDL
jgi:hypothetical protein